MATGNSESGAPVSPRLAWFASTLKGRRHVVEQMTEAVDNNRPGVLRDILASHAATEAQLTSCLQLALLRRSDLYHSCVEELLKAGARATANNGHGSPLLVGAAESGCHSIVLLLLQHGASVDSMRLDRVSALHRAVTRGHTEVVRLLLDAGADPSVQDSQGRTPAMLALRNGHREVLKALIEHENKHGLDGVGRRGSGIGLGAQDQDGVCLLHLAVEQQDEELVSFIVIKHPCCVDLCDTSGKTPIMAAAHQGNAAILELMLDVTSEIDRQNQQGETALLISAKQQNLDCLASLVEAGADMDIADLSGSVPLAHVVQYPALVARLLELGANADGEEDTQRNHVKLPNCNFNSFSTLSSNSSFHRSSSLPPHDTSSLAPSSNTVPVLLSSPSPSPQADSPLVAATRGVCLETVRWLLLGGADPGKSSGSGDKCPLQIALYEGSLDLVKLLYRGSVCNLCSLKWLQGHVQDASINDDPSQIWTWIEQELRECQESETVPSLQAISRLVIRHAVGTESLLQKLDSLPLPKSLLRYVQFQELMDT